MLSTNTGFDIVFDSLRINLAVAVVVPAVVRGLKLRTGRRDFFVGLEPGLEFIGLRSVDGLIGWVLMDGPGRMVAATVLLWSLVVLGGEVVKERDRSMMLLRKSQEVELRSEALVDVDRLASLRVGDGPDASRRSVRGGSAASLSLVGFAGVACVTFVGVVRLDL